jgi:hypothetical protein
MRRNKTMQQVDFPPNVPKKLIRLYRKLGTFRAMEKALGVNIYYIRTLMVVGKEPTNGDIRVKLFLPRKPKAKRLRVKARPAWLDDLRQLEIEKRKP